MNSIKVVSILSLSVAAACGGGKSTGEAAATDTTAASHEGMEGMPMPQTQAAADSSGMDAELANHMRMMQGATGDSLRAMVPLQRQMAANMLARMNREMTEMNMTADPDWTASADSIRHDLTRMPEMGADDLRDFIPAHEARLNRLASMHRSMMSHMNM